MIPISILALMVTLMVSEAAVTSKWPQGSLLTSNLNSLASMTYVTMLFWPLNASRRWLKGRSPIIIHRLAQCHGQRPLIDRHEQCHSGTVTKASDNVLVIIRGNLSLSHLAWPQFFLEIFAFNSNSNNWLSTFVRDVLVYNTQQFWIIRIMRFLWPWRSLFFVAGLGIVAQGSRAGTQLWESSFQILLYRS